MAHTYVHKGPCKAHTHLTHEKSGIRPVWFKYSTVSSTSTNIVFMGSLAWISSGKFDPNVYSIQHVPCMSHRPGRRRSRPPKK